MPLKHALLGPCALARSRFPCAFCLRPPMGYPRCRSPGPPAASLSTRARLLCQASRCLRRTRVGDRSGWREGGIAREREQNAATRPERNEQPRGRQSNRPPWRWASAAPRHRQQGGPAERGWRRSRDGRLMTERRGGAANCYYYLSVVSINHSINQLF